jgi:hypothetical protein
LIIKDGMKLCGNSASAKVQSLGHFTGMLQAQSHVDAMMRMGLSVQQLLSLLHFRV